MKINKENFWEKDYKNILSITDKIWWKYEVLEIEEWYKIKKFIYKSQKIY